MNFFIQLLKSNVSILLSIDKMISFLEISSDKILILQNLYLSLKYFKLEEFWPEILEITDLFALIVISFPLVVNLLHLKKSSNANLYIFDSTNCLKAGWNGPATTSLIEYSL